MEYTPIHSRFWSDGWVRGLNALDRYLFLYLLSNGRAKLTGIYELPLDLMASESGIDERDLRMSMLQRLEPKIFYKEGWVIVVNYPKHKVGGGHKYNQGVRANFEELPAKIQELAKDCGYPIHTLSIGYTHFPIRVDKSRVEENRIDTSADEPREVLEEVSEKYKTPPKYPHSKEVFGLWGKHPANWKTNRSQLQAAENLYAERGLSEVKDALDFYNARKGDKFCPEITSPFDLDSKWSKLEAFNEKL